MNSPFFTVLMPAFQAAGFIRSAIRDVLAQNFQDFELLIIDDGSTDRTADVVRSFTDPRIRLISLTKNSGLVAALNEGLEAARGLWVARQDADDRCSRGRLRVQREICQSHPDAAFIYSRARLIDERGWWRGTLRTPVKDSELRWDLGFRNSVPHTSVVFRTELVRGLKYSGDNVTADFDLWSRLLQCGKAVGDARSLVSYRNHRKSIMGRENHGKKRLSDDGVGKLMEHNVVTWSGASASEAGILSGAWLQTAACDWEQYFVCRENLVGRVLHPSMETVAEEDFTLMNRAFGVSKSCGNNMLQAMRSVCAPRFHALPQPRTFLSRLLS